MKKFLLVLMSFVMIFCLCSFAPIEDTASPNYKYTSSCSSYLSISGTTATCISKLTGYYGETTKIVVTQTLQVKNGTQWRSVNSWTATYNSHACNFLNTRTIYSGNTYRVKSEYKVYAGSSYETVYSYSATSTT